MKNVRQAFAWLLLVSLIASSCEKQENKVYFDGGAAPVLASSTTAGQVLKFADAANNSIRLSWTNPNYQFTTGISSQDVTYSIQFDTTGANFSSPLMQEVVVSKDLSKQFTVAELNAVMSKLNLQEDKPHNIDMRVKSSLSSGSVPLFSNVVKVVVTPYLDVAVPLPASGKLYITGSATPANWMGGGDPEVVSQRFTRNGAVFEITIALSANNSFLLVPEYGNWGAKYGFTGPGNTNNVAGDNFTTNGNDLKAPTVTGTYKITVNFKTGRYDAVKQ